MTELSESSILQKHDTDMDPPPWSSIGGDVWRRLKLNFNKAKKMTNEETSTTKRQWGVTFVRGMSAFQLFLGFCCIVIALFGLAATFDAKRVMSMSTVEDLKVSVRDLYIKGLRDVTNAAWNDRTALIDYFRKVTTNLKFNTSDEYQYQYIYNNLPSAKLPRRAYDLPEYYDYGSFDLENNIDGKVMEFRLIMEYLCVPAWIGIMYIITGLVGLRTMSSKKKIQFLQVSHSYTLLNFLGVILLAPGMMALGILELHFSHIHYAYERGLIFTFRIVVGKVTIGFGAVCLLVSLALCFVSCCCPVSPGLQDNHYEGLLESEESLAKEKQQEEDEEKIIIA